MLRFKEPETQQLLAVVTADRYVHGLHFQRQVGFHLGAINMLGLSQNKDNWEGETQQFHHKTRSSMLHYTSDSCCMIDCKK